MVNDYKQLGVWKEAHQLAIDMYSIARSLSKEEKFCLGQQLKRAATSIPLNIAEGCGRRTEKDFISFLYNSLGSVKETEAILLLLKDLRMIKDEEWECHAQKIDKIGKMLYNLIKSRQENTTSEQQR